MHLSNNSTSIHNNKISSNLNFSNYERFNRVLSFLELPFFFDNDSSKFYRFEGSIYNFNYEITYRNFSVDLNLGLKVKTKLLMSLFMQLPTQLQSFDGRFSSKTSFLLNNSFFKVNQNFSNVNYNNLNDYFNISPIESYYKKLYNVSVELSDVSLNLVSPRNKFNRIVEFNMTDLDTFISTVNANWVNINNLDISFHRNSLRSLTVVNDNVRTFSFLVSSLDNFKVLHSQFFNKYLYFKNLHNSLKLRGINNLFTLNKAKAYYLFFYTNLISSLDSFFYKNLNYIFIYNYVIKFLLNILINYKILPLYYSFYFKYILMFLSSCFFLESSLGNSLVDIRSTFVVKKSILHTLKPFFILFKNEASYTLNLPLSLFLKSFSNNRKFFLKSKVNTSIFFPLNYAKLAARDYKKCYHKYSIHYQPAEIFSAVSKLGYTATSISYMTAFSNLKTYNYAEKSILTYYNFLKFFSDFILYFFKRNLVNSVLVNNYYNPKYLMFRYFSTFKQFFPILFKRWLLNNNFNISGPDLSLINNYLNYALTTKNITSLKYKKTKFQKKMLLKSKFTKISKTLSLKDSTIYTFKSRAYSTDSNFNKLVNLFSNTMFNKMYYYDFNIFFVNLGFFFHFNNINLSIYFYYLLNCLLFDSKIISKKIILSNFFFVLDYKLLCFLELIKNSLSVTIFNKNIIVPLFRYNDFILKVDFYTFIILKRFIEYFRIFKYNEYLSYNNINTLIYMQLSKSSEDFSFLPSFFEFKRSIFFNKYLIFKFYSKKNIVSTYNNNINYDSFLNFSFFQFFLITLSIKKVFNIFFRYFYIYLISNLYYFLYKSLFLSSRDLQLVNINFLSKLFFNLKKKIICKQMFSFISRQKLHQLFLNSSTFSYNNLVFFFNKFNLKFSLFNDITNILVVNFMDNFVFTRLLELQSYQNSNIFDFFKKMVLRAYFNFIDVDSINHFFNVNVIFLKRKLDFFLWSIYNFIFVLNYNSLYLNDLLLFVNKLHIDNYLKTISFKFANFVQYPDNSLNMSNFFFYFILARDYTLKLLSRLFIFSYFYKLYFIYFFCNYLKQIQFFKIRLIVLQLKYYKIFNTFFNSNFNYLIYDASSN